MPELPITIGAAWALVKLRFQDKLAMTHDLANDLLQMGVELLVMRQVWIALYAGRPVMNGVSLAQALTYVTLNTVVVRLFFTWIIYDEGEKIRSGDIIFNITRPMYYGNILLFLTLGATLAVFLTSSLPVFALVCLALHPLLPASPLVWLAFGGSLVLGFLTNFFIDYLLALTGFWTTATGGAFLDQRQHCRHPGRQLPAAVDLPAFLARRGEPAALPRHRLLPACDLYRANPAGAGSRGVCAAGRLAGGADRTEPRGIRRGAEAAGDTGGVKCCG